MTALRDSSRADDLPASGDSSQGSGMRRMREQHAHRYLYWVRPGFLVLMIALLVSAHVDPHTANTTVDYLAFLAATVVSAISLILVHRGVDPLRVAAVSAAFDLLLAFGWVVGGDYPAQSSIVLVWPIIVIAYFGHIRVAQAATMIASVALWIAAIRLDSWGVPGPLPIAVCGLFGAGLLISFVTSQGRRVEQALVASLARDRVALSLARRIRMAGDPGNAITEIARTVGQAAGAARCLVVLLEHDDDYVADIATWSSGRAPQREHRRIDITSIDATLRHLVASGHGVLLDPDGVHLLAPADGGILLAPGDSSIGASLQLLLEQMGSVYGLVSPLQIGGRAIGAIVLGGGPDVDWSNDVLALLEPLAPQLAAGLAQVVLVRDQRDALDSLERVDRMRNRLIANVSHELRTPLTSTLGFVETLLRDDIELPERQRHELMEHARDGGLRLLALVEDLLALGSIRPEALDLEPTPIDAGRLLMDALRGIEAPAGRTFRVDVVDDAAIIVDRNRMLQVLSNLVVNAIRHGAGDVELRCTRIEQRIVFDVIDHGRGIAPEHLHELFLPFATFSSRPDSTGLGLAICRSIVEAHAGTIDYDRIDQGRTRFRVRLPMRTPSA
jgi:signal transduction histidine kinase